MKKIIILIDGILDINSSEKIEKKIARYVIKFMYLETTTSNTKACFFEVKANRTTKVRSEFTVQQ